MSQSRYSTILQRRNPQVMNSKEHRSFMNEVNFAVYSHELRQIPAAAYHKAAEDYALYGTLYLPHYRAPQSYVNGSNHTKGSNVNHYQNSWTNFRTNQNCKEMNCRTSNKTRKNIQYSHSSQTNYSQFSQISNCGVNPIATQYLHAISSNQFTMCYSNSVTMYPLSFLICHWYCPFQTGFLNAPQYYDRNHQIMRMQNPSNQWN